MLLSAARATVPSASEAEYLAAARRLGQLLVARGRRFWLFRLRGASGEYLEFTECAGPEPPRGGPGRTGASSNEELELVVQLRRLARYATDAEAIWEEVP